ncbi:MAG: hypothetical protein M5U01_24455 [Ardenticatenaceae bacterium]|nr:hypothetical protein [Ardenticatenaceae bacterium]
MKVYEVVRTGDGDVMAFVNGDPLYHVIAHTPDGFTFGRGPGADDLALSILADFFGERPTLEDLYEGDCLCKQYHHDFKWAFVTPASARQALTVTSDEIATWLEQH